MSFVVFAKLIFQKLYFIRTNDNLSIHKKIYNNAFKTCASLDKEETPSSVKNEKKAFNGCTSLELE